MIFVLGVFFVFLACIAGALYYSVGGIGNYLAKLELEKYSNFYTKELKKKNFKFRMSDEYVIVEIRDLYDYEFTSCKMRFKEAFVVICDIIEDRMDAEGFKNLLKAKRKEFEVKNTPVRYRKEM